MIKNKKGWIKIVEAFIAIMIIMSVLLIVINKEYVNSSDASEKIYEAETSILYSIISDDIIKKSVIEFSVNLDNPASIPANVDDKRKEATPDYLDCRISICSSNNACEQSSEVPSDKNIYSQSIVVRNEDISISKVLKIFCWIK